MLHLRVRFAVSRCSSSFERDSCTNTRRVLVQRWPAVPTAPNTMDGTARSRLANSSTMMRVVAAKLEQALAETRGDALADLATDGRRAGERHQVDAAIIDELLRQLGAGADEQLEDAGKALTLAARG